MPSIASEHRFIYPPFAGKRRASLAVRALSIALILSAISMAAAPIVAQEDCSYPDDWDDFQWFRDCLERHGLTDDWKPWMLHGAASLTGNPAIIRLLLDAGSDANAVDDDGLTPLHQRELGVSPQLCGMVVPGDGRSVSAAERGGVGVPGQSRNGDGALLG